MTIQINISEKELQHKISLAIHLLTYTKLLTSSDKLNYDNYLRNINYCQDRLNGSGHYGEIYSDLVHIESLLLEFISNN